MANVRNMNAPTCAHAQALANTMHLYTCREGMRVYTHVHEHANTHVQGMAQHARGMGRRQGQGRAVDRRARPSGRGSRTVDRRAHLADTMTIGRSRRCTSALRARPSHSIHNPYVHACLRDACASVPPAQTVVQDGTLHCAAHMRGKEGQRRAGSTIGQIETTLSNQHAPAMHKHRDSCQEALPPSAGPGTTRQVAKR